MAPPFGGGGKARRRRHSRDYVEEAERSPRHRRQARRYGFGWYRPLVGPVVGSEERHSQRGGGARPVASPSSATPATPAVSVPPEAAERASRPSPPKPPKPPRVVAIGGGTGLSVLLRGLKHHA